MSKILVTGGAGFIGSNFIRYWLKNNENDHIINLDKLTYAGNLDSLSDVIINPNYKFVQGDICNTDLVNDLTVGVDLIINFAAESHVDRSILSSADFVKTNIDGTRVLLEAARKNGNIRFHQISTDEVFGSLSLSDPRFNENTPYDPRSPYSASKAAADHLVRAYYHTYNLPVTISNCSNNYGPYQFPEKLIPLFITNLLRGKKVPVYGSGNNIRDWIHVDDHNRGIEMIVKKGNIGETYCLGGGNEMKNIDITKIILSNLGFGEEMIEFVEDRLGHDFRYAIDFSKAQKNIDWEPQINFEDGLKNTIDWYKNNTDWWEKIINNRS
ncbi:MAG TPA: dTDP-glucose 4,6-dehydratase [bacterium]|nr:dTDP-glucose 4,6-dehydratase [bacterium]HPV65382.1 dTDP-glucose 4,6-dehydratase [bacterium]